MSIKLELAADLGGPKTLTPDAPPPAAPSPFDLDSLRIDPSFEKVAGVKRVLSTIPVRKPNKQEWIRVHPHEAYRANLWAINLKEEGEVYLATPHIARDYVAEVTPVTLYACVNTSGVTFMWPARLQAVEERPNNWYSSAHEAAGAAMGQWVRIVSNMSLGAYEHFVSDSKMEPQWPAETFLELIHIAFRKAGRFVDSVEHPVMKQLLGRM